MVRSSSKPKSKSKSRPSPKQEADERALQCAMENAKYIANERSVAGGLISVNGTGKDVRWSVPSLMNGQAVRELGQILHMEKLPNRIECYDISDTHGDVVVGSRVVFINGRPTRHLCRKFHIKTVDGIDNYASLEEVLECRFCRAWRQHCRAGGKNNNKDNIDIGADKLLVDSDDLWLMPDLVVIDNGKGQPSAALKGMAKADRPPT